MIHKKKIHIPASDEILELYVSNCLDCNGDDIKIEEYEDQYGLISTATCKNCTRTIKQNVSEMEIIKQWNEKNDIALLVRSKLKLIHNTNEEIKILKLKAIQRSKDIQKLKEKQKK